MTVRQTDPISTGIDVLDRELGGGVPRGAVVALSASPASQSELFLYEFASTRETLYLSTVRTAATVERALENRGVDRESVEVVRADPDEPLDHAREILADLPEETNFVVDPIGVLEERDDYRQFLADLKQRAGEGGNGVLLHCLGRPSSARRCDTVHVADLAFELSTELDGQSVVNRLTVPKFRGGQSVDDVVKLDLTSEVEVDMSRNIV